MENAPLTHRLLSTIDVLLGEMIEQQRLKTLKIARRLRPNVTDDDIQDPHSIPELVRSPEFSYEDGMLAGLAAARIAVLRDATELLRKEQEGGE